MVIVSMRVKKVLNKVCGAYTCRIFKCVIGQEMIGRGTRKYLLKEESLPSPLVPPQFKHCQS